VKLQVQAFCNVASPTQSPDWSGLIPLSMKCTCRVLRKWPTPYPNGANQSFPER
jgi:hypothetical protein